MFDVHRGSQQEAWRNSEDALIGALLADPTRLHEVSDLVSKSDFFQQDRAELFSLIQWMDRAGMPVGDIATLVAEMRKTGLYDSFGGAPVIAKLASYYTASSAVWYASEVRKWSNVSKLRESLIDGLSALDSLDPDTDSVFTSIDARKDASTVYRDYQIVTAADAMNEASDEMRAKLSKGETSGLPTGFGLVDEMTGGLFPSELVVLAAATGYGKTAFSMEVAARVAEAGRRVFVVSLEMKASQLGQRYLARTTGIPVSFMRQLDLRQSDFEKFDSATKVESYPRIRMLLSQGVTMEKIRSIVRAQASKVGFDLLIVDYLSKIKKRDRRLTEREHVSECVNELKELAMDTGKAVLVLSQLNREGQKGKPSLSNLAESSSVERDADFVWFLSGETDQPEVVLTVAKARQGRRGDIALKFNSAKMRWAEDPNRNMNPKLHGQAAV